MSYQHYFKHDLQERNYDHDVATGRNNCYMTPSLTSPVAVKQEPRDMTYDGKRAIYEPRHEECHMRTTKA